MRLPIAHGHNDIRMWDFLFQLSNKPLSIKTSVRLYYRVRFNMASTDTMQWCLVSVVWWHLHICSSWYTVQQLLWYNVPHYGFIYLVIGLFQCTTLTAGNLWTTLLCGRYSFGHIPCVGFYLLTLFSIQLGCKRSFSGWGLLEDLHMVKPCAAPFSCEPGLFNMNCWEELWATCKPCSCCADIAFIQQQKPYILLMCM